MKNFIGRRRELTLLGNAYTDSKSSFIPIYGRRRVGKSELILHFIKEKPALYYLGKKAPEQFQIQEFVEIAAANLNNFLLNKVRPDSWKEALQIVVSEYRKYGQKLILALDEFQWIVESSKGLPSILQELWDREWKESNDIVLILCGSYLGFMEREVLGSKSPLFGRRTAQILLKPFSFAEAGEFHPSWSYEDKAKAWFICGGIPYYLQFLQSHKSIDQNICTALLNEYAALYREADFLLREELRDLEKYSGVLMAIAESPLTVKEIALKSGIAERSIPYYLDTLKTLHFIDSFAALDTNGFRKRGIKYRLQDNFLKFWFRFIYPHLSLITQMGEEKAFTTLIKPQLESWYGTSFEFLCREALAEIYIKEGVLSSFSIGEYWDKDVQIDIVGVRVDKRVDLCECKWGQIKSIPSLVQEIEQKELQYPNSNGYTVQKRVFVKSALTMKNSDIICHTLKDLYEITL